MKYFKKTKKLVEGKSFDRQERDKINDITSDLNDQQREKESENQLKPSGDGADQQIRAPVNPDGSPVSLDDIKDRQPEKGIEGIGGTQASSVGIGTHGNQKRGGIFNKLYRGANTLDSMWQTVKKGMPMRPVEGDLYEDEEGNLRRFGKVTTGRAGGNPYYFEFDHYDKGSDQNLVLYGIAPGGNMQGAELRPIQLKVKAIVPRDKMDVRPMTAPTDANVQSNFVSEVKYTPPPLGGSGGSRTGGGKGTDGSSGWEVASSKEGGNFRITDFTVDGAVHDGQGGVRDEGTGRFLPGNQSGVQFAKGGNAEKNEIEAVTSNAVKVIGKQVPSLREVMRGGSSFGYSSSSDDGDDGGGGSDGRGGGWYGGGGGGGGGFTTIRRQYRPNYKKQDSDQVNIPKNLWYHPAIQRMIKRMIASDKGKKRVKIGGYYGMLVRRDPADKDSDYKLVRKIPRSHIPKIFLDDDFIAEILEIVPIPPDLGGPGIAAAAVPALGMVVSQTTGLPLNASAGAAKEAISQTGNQLNIAGKAAPLELPNIPAGAGKGEINIGKSPVEVPALSLTENKKLSSLIQGVELNENFAEWLGSAVGSGVKITRDMAGKTKQAIKSAVTGFEKSSGVKLNKIDYQNILSGIAYDIKHPIGGDYEQPEWSGDIKGGPDDVDLDPDNNVDFVGGERPDPEGRPEEPTPEPTPGPTPEPTPEPSPDESKPEEEYKMKWVSPAYDEFHSRHPYKFDNVDFDEVNEKLKQVDREVDELYNNMTLEQGVESMLKGYKEYDDPKPSPAHMLGIADEPADEVEKSVNTRFRGGDFTSNYTKNKLANLLVTKNLWPDLTIHDVLASPIRFHDNLKEPTSDIASSVDEWVELVGHHNKGIAIRQWLSKELGIPMFTDDQTRVDWFGGGGKNSLQGTQSALQYLGRIAWEQNKINVFLPDYKFNPKHFRSEKYDPGQKDHNMDHNVPQDSDFNMHTTAYADTPAGQPSSKKFFDKGSPGPGQWGNDLIKKVDAEKKEKQKQKDRDEQKKNSSLKFKKKSRKKSRKKRLEESFDNIRKLVTGN